MKPLPWSDAMVTRFIRDWEEGLETHALRQRYGTSNPKAKAQQLRKAGHKVGPRPSMAVSLPFTLLRRPEDSARKWTSGVRSGVVRTGRQA